MSDDWMMFFLVILSCIVAVICVFMYENAMDKCLRSGHGYTFSQCEELIR